MIEIILTIIGLLIGSGIVYKIFITVKNKNSQQSNKISTIFGSNNNNTIIGTQNNNCINKNDRDDV